jgi:UDP-3-O-[3-hydroxymyristoyl] glucosamine N-acyltransferase
VPETLTFLDDAKFLDALRANPNVTAAFVTPELDRALGDAPLTRIVCDDPRYYFYALHNHLAGANYRRTPSRIHETAVVHPRAFVAEHNVEIGAHTVVEPNATVLPDVVVGAHCVIRPGAVLGTEGFEHKRTSRGILSVRHTGRVVLGDHVEIGANACLDKGLNERDTVVGDHTKVDNLVHIAHGAHVGSRCFVIACAMVAGTVTVEDDAWVGPNASVAPQVTIGRAGFVSLGSVVTRAVAAGQHVSGNFAIDHRRFLDFLKSIR